MAYQEAFQFDTRGQDQRRYQLQLRQMIVAMRITFTPKPLTVHTGYGTSYPVATVPAYAQQDILLPSPTDTITFSWEIPPNGSFDDGLVQFFVSGEPLFPLTVPLGVPLAQADTNDPLEEWPRQNRWGSVSMIEQTAEHVGSVGQMLPSLVQDDPLTGDTIYYQPGNQPWNYNSPVEPYDPRSDDRENTYMAHLRRTARPYNSGLVFAAAGRQPLLSLYATQFTPPNTNWGSRRIQIESLQVALMSSTAAAEVYAELVWIDAAAALPAGGAVVAPYLSEAPLAPSMLEIRRLPTPATVVEVGVPLSAAVWLTGITGAVPVTNPPPPQPFQELIPQRMDNKGQRPIVTGFDAPATGYGMAVMIDVDVATTVRFHATIVYTERNAGV